MSTYNVTLGLQIDGDLGCLEGLLDIALQELEERGSIADVRCTASIDGVVKFDALLKANGLWEAYGTFTIAVDKAMQAADCQILTTRSIEVAELATPVET